ncbi:biotin--[acetyl-CoA-carboxylase] ligase [Paracraurococcus ruber]|uniref:Biotin--[acetyl-CoA-carboxylase] ligase n=1 Tax=Paracraurococcus ruber TaxID=77675 RepID=A0ABS1CQS1_9PROT|nr:biotin--[acetyl-CoA-carboxylase] ligase [Paracraurococcus ruber]TDG32013.1 biotin--[acetyl-CoA-carboxylase] ligase [Paracraurococcus ruber]
MPPGWVLEAHDSLPSTSALLARRAEAGAPEGLAILAREQTAGRGRAGRVWASPRGNLYLSVLLRPEGPAREAPQWSLLAGVALAEAAAAVLRDPAALRLKWPNDLLLGGAKCAGILAETALLPGGGLAWLSLGIGVNLARAPALPDRRTAWLDAGLSPDAFAPRLLARLGHWRAVQRAEGFAPVRAAWRRFGPAVGEAITLHGLDAPARFVGLAEDGSLLLEVAGTCRAIPAGEVLSQGGVASHAAGD